MPVEALRRPARTPVGATPPRLRPKGPVGRQAPEPRPKQSAVERLEADKAKYVKSQEALSKQQPIRAAEGRRPAPSPAPRPTPSPASALRPAPSPASALRPAPSPASALRLAPSPTSALRPAPNPASALRPTRRAQTPTKAKQVGGVQLDLEHLSNLISDVSDGPASSATASSEESKAPPPAAGTPQKKKERPVPPPRPARPDWAGPAKVRLKSSAELSPSPGSPAVGTVRRVDVVPQAGPPRAACRPPQFMRQPLQPVPLHPQFALRPAVSHLRLFHPRTNNAPPSPLKPVVAAPPVHPAPPAGATPTPPAFPLFPPPSPAVTRRSSTSSRKRPSLTRSKSDMSDRFSRAGTELERFFNLCGLDPADLHDLPGSSSDIVSLARFRSVSAPGSECAGSGEGGEEEEEDAGNVAMRVPYGVSVIERNARVIKWLYGMRQAKDTVGKSTNL